jgi:hypothetical protein
MPDNPKSYPTVTLIGNVPLSLNLRKGMLRPADAARFLAALVRADVAVAVRPSGEQIVFRGQEHFDAAGADGQLHRHSVMRVAVANPVQVWLLDDAIKRRIRGAWTPDDARKLGEMLAVATIFEDVDEAGEDALWTAFLVELERAQGEPVGSA